MKKYTIIMFSLLIVVILLSTKSFAQRGWLIEEIKNADGSVTRTYRKNDINKIELNNSSSDKDIDKEDIKNLLFELGMERDFIEKLSDKDLEEYANSPQIVGTVSYIKTDILGNKEIVSEDEALRKIEVSKKEFNPQKLSEHDTYEDEYMRVFHMVSQMPYNSEKFKFSTDARWLKMPFFRKFDSIGSCAQYMACDDDTASGWYEYDITEWHMGDDIETRRDGGNLYRRDFEFAINGSFSGLAALIDLPNDFNSDYTFIHYSDFKVHAEHYAYINEPDHTINFTSYGTYDHLRYKLGFKPSISISTSGYSASIGLDVFGDTDKRTSSVVVRYER